jgi:hypothetical protein
MTAIHRNERRRRRSLLTLETCEARVLMATVVPLGTATSYAVLGGTTVTNAGVSNIVGDVGVSPGTSITGLSPGAVSGGTIHAGDASAAVAEETVATAYQILADKAVDTSLSSQDLGGMTLTPGVYNFSAGAQLHGVLTLDAQGDPNAVFVIQTGSTLTTASNSSIVLINRASADNVYWQVGSSATLGASSAFEGNLLALTSITLGTSADISPGRAFAINGAVTMDSNAISRPLTISGTVFLDLNASGVNSPNDPGLVDRVVYVDLHGDGTLHADDPQAVTDAAGHYRIGGLTAGQYVLRVKTFSNDNPTGPSGSQLALNLTTGQVLIDTSFGLQPGSTIVPRTTTPTPFLGGTTTQEAIIESLYRTLLGRQGQSAEIQGWVGSVQAGETYADIAKEFLGSPEYRTNVIKADYLTLLGRTAEPAGIASWLAAFQAGWTETQISEAFVTTSEYNAKHADSSDYVESLYANVLGRDATVSEIVGWDAQLGTGMARSVLAADVIDSTEAYLRGIDGDYTAFLARVGDAPGVAHWLSLVQQGTLTLAGVEAEFFDTSEFALRASKAV